MNPKSNSGFTLMELLVVLLIIGLLSTVAIRTIDATRDRGLFDQTTKEMKEIIYAMVGNPNLTANGRRVDFGFYGDMMRLPLSLRELVENTTSSPNWHGPYFRVDFLQDTVGYRLDAWGNPYTYDPEQATIATLGNGKYPMTMRIVDSVTHLTNNYIVGNVTDGENNPPGDKATTVGIKLIFPDGTYYFTTPDPGGFYEFSPSTHGPIHIGTHKIVASRPGGDSIVRLVTVLPRSKVTVDFRFARPFKNYLQMVGKPTLSNDSAGFIFKVVNAGGEEVLVSSFAFMEAPDDAFMGDGLIKSEEEEHQINLTPPLPGKGDSVSVSPAFGIQPDRGEEVWFSLNFQNSPSGGGKANIYSKRFRLRFNDGSEIVVIPR
ncbi:MAG: prepilin-type N-terminal cleavage/methylation domain-containing protein [candidate division WOR-3 bacterium]